MLHRSGLVLAGWLFLLPGIGLAADDAYFDSNGVKIHYIVEGKGEPVLLIHGFTASIETQWAAPGILKALARRYRVIALDNRGHGKSGKPHDPNKYGTEMVEDAVRLLDHLKVKKAHVVGYSMGGLIVCKLIVTHPDRLLSATMGGSGGLRVGAAPLRFNVLADSLEQGKGFGPLIDFLTPAGRPGPTPEMIKLINLRLEAANDTKALAAVTRSLPRLEVTDEQLKANRVPTLALVGEIDPLKKSVDDMKGRMSNLKIVVIPDADHITAFYQPEFLQALQGFLARHPRKIGAPAAPLRQ